MPAFHPTTSSIDPPPHPDLAADAVVRSLGRHLIRRHPWGPIKTLILGGLTFGILPAFSWARNLNSFIVAEQRQLWHLAEWLHQRKSDAELDLRPLVHDPKAGGIFGQTLVLLLALIGVWGAIGFLHEAAPTAILHVTYRFGFHRHYSVAYLAWVSLLTAVYVLQARHIHWRYANFRAYVDRFNLRMQCEKLAPVAVPALTGWRVLLWLLVALPGIIFGAFWIIPAAITGSLQATYMLTVSRLTRKQLSARVYQLLAREHPDKHLPVPMHSRVFCPNPACRAEIPKDAAACPRCGRPVRPDSAATV